MREALFVKQNSAKWENYGRMETKNPDEIAERFIELTDDLGYAKTFYPKSKTTAYLNGLASRFHQSIYKNKKEKSGRFISYWKFELPFLFRVYRKEILYSFLFFAAFFLMGVLSARYDNRFLSVVLGDHYVNMTNENIAKGDPFGVYKQQGEVIMFLSIAANNVFVLFMVFVNGIFLSVGTVYHLVRNGIMIGSFQYFFIEKGLGIESVLVIWIHGTLEISSLIISGTTGLILGNSILFPGTYTRMQSFTRGVKDAMKISVGIVPIVITAAFLEGFVTRHTEMPWWLSVAILLASLCFIIWYVILYPNKIAKLTNE